MKCPHCAARVLTNSAFCHRCGQPLIDPGVHSVPAAVKEHAPEPKRSDRRARAGDRDEVERELWRGTYSAKGMADLGSPPAW